MTGPKEGGLQASTSTHFSELFHRLRGRQVCRVMVGQRTSTAHSASRIPCEQRQWPQTQRPIWTCHPYPSPYRLLRLSLSPEKSPQPPFPTNFTMLFGYIGCATYPCMSGSYYHRYRIYLMVSPWLAARGPRPAIQTPD